ncbi:MAG: hypothetical protein OQK48_05135 [Sulfurimonas sp.]|uniref:hypothetical protein n=1 Tax=Sulfurimonas sp. TaxID=2022749 RepID=UPI002602DEAA|nr:hypothetical protein [Sulfurimonas sp.]MCW8895769.1 hypothetical protein [Sulfurimonas sp.]MCW8954309.1 hypothetical protein [Sulfurimonas sp.]MCW9067848.1 hypothetical protein [Sulfurimonas sp.]
MKSIILWAVTILVFLNIDAFAKTLAEDAFSVSYINDKVDLAPVVLLKIRPETASDIAFKLAISSSLLELKEKTLIDSNLVSRIALLVSYRF